MKISFALIILSSIFFAGCAAYKELEPEPQVLFAEDGYIELLDDGDKFELDEGKKYFIRFPQASADNIYLVLTFKDKSPIISYLTRVFDDGEGPVIKMTDESDEPAISSVYLLDKTVPMFYWVIEDVRKDFVLDMTYRYVAVWRYRFEKKHAEFKQILADNTQSRKILEELGTSISLSEIDYSGEKAGVIRMSENIKKVGTQLHEIEEILPPQILNSDDQAYKDYLLLKEQIDDELAFQTEYKQIMELLENISRSKPDIDKFVALAPGYEALLADTSAYNTNFFNEVNKGLEKTLPGVAPYYEKQLNQKKDSTPADLDLQPVVALYPVAGIPKDDKLVALNDFVSTYNQRANALLKVKQQISDLDKELTTKTLWPTNQYYFDKRAELSRIKYTLPQSDSKAYGSYQSLACASALNQSIRSEYNRISMLDNQFQRAGSLVPQINQYRQQGKYKQILGILKQNADLGFLKFQYAELDELSINQQLRSISGALAANSFQQAEFDLRAFDQDQNFLNPGTMIPRKNKLVQAYEDSLYQKVQRVSINNANKFIDENLNTIDNVDSLYTNPALFPVHTFGYSRTPGGAATKNQNLSTKMTALRTKTFPEKAIDTIYRTFIDAFHQRGVEKARAIVVHGHNYSGDNKKYINLIAECDPTASKWITKAKEFRRLYALPITNNIGGTNTYMAKINIQIPSEAKFPLYDVNVKLPLEVGRHAGSRQWYETITFNNKVLKNEGRFTITAPDPDNDYIAQITPLQVNKTGNNVIEIRFKYDAFKVLELSVMAQKPIIKKN